VKNLKPLAIVSALALSAIYIAMTGCKKGDTGPQGPAGPDSVSYSKWTALAMTDKGRDKDTTSPTYGLEIYEQIIAAPAITSAIINKGMILTYMQSKDAHGDTIVVNAENLLSEVFHIGKIDAQSAGVNYSGINFRYVVIPGNILTTKYAGLTPQQIKSMNYLTITKDLNIPANKSGANQVSN